MKTVTLIGWLAAGARAFAQGTFLYDQQSSTNEAPLAYGSGSEIHSILPSTGQSFTPSFSELNFIRLKFADGGVTPPGATISLNLRSDSITGTILGTTAPVTMPIGFAGPQNFYFPTTITLSPMTTYYFDLDVQANGRWYVDIYSYYYRGGTAFARGAPVGAEYWFREGLYIVPEPSAAVLGLIGGAAFVAGRKRFAPISVFRPLLSPL
jgi:hypothetical protein